MHHSCPYRIFLIDIHTSYITNKVTEHLRQKAPMQAIFSRFRSLGARWNNEDVEILDFDSCPRDLRLNGEPFCHPRIRCSVNHSSLVNYTRRNLLGRAMKYHSCVDQNFANFRVLQLIRNVERREGLTFTMVIRSRIDIYWPAPLPNICRFRNNSLLGFSDYYHFFPRSLVLVFNFFSSFYKGIVVIKSNESCCACKPLRQHMGNVWLDLVEKPPHCESKLLFPIRSCGSSRPEDVYYHQGFIRHGVPITDCWPTFFFQVNIPRIHRGWDAVEQNALEAYRAHPDGAPPAATIKVLIEGPFAQCRGNQLCVQEAAEVGMDIRTGTGLSPEVQKAINSATEEYKKKRGP